MEIRIADKAGFCFGVKRAVDMAIDYTSKNENVYSYGQLIHNDQVTERLNGLQKVDDLEGIEDASLIIRSHGVSKSIYDQSNKNHLEVIDCTCPYVKKVHKIVDKHYNDGYKIIVVGNSDHPEIIGINGWCDNTALIVPSADHIVTLNKDKYCVVAQTTLKLAIWEEVVKKLQGFSYDIVFHNTICSATSQRQEAAKKLAPEVDLMIVIGGYHSSNTRKLYEICSDLCEETIHVEKKSDLVMTNPEKYDIIGITAGASTPDWVIQEIVDYLEKMQ